ncbi:MAG TPA: sigma-70 family RNA polymerase sigma factor [Acidimicrobiales bacterium]|nr:sigma-70 family RNA polymerase sigma factor [Acidimicrobiales bacterium]
MQDGTPTSPSDDADWQQIYRRHAGRLRRIIARRVPSAAVEDVLQETFLRAYRSRHTLDGSRPAGPWLTTIAVRTASDLRPKRVDATFSEEAAPAAPDAHEELRRSTRLRAVESAFASLRPRQRRLLAAVAIEGTSQAELARREGIAPEAVRAAVFRARQRFEACLERLSRESGLAGVPWLRPTVARLRARFDRFEVHVPVGADALLGLAALAVFATASSAALPAPPASASPPDAARSAPVQPGDVEPATATATAPAPAAPRRGSPEVGAGIRVTEERVPGEGAGAAITLGPRRRTVHADALGTHATVQASDETRTLRLSTDGPASNGSEAMSFHCTKGITTGLVCAAYDVVVPVVLEPVLDSGAVP